MFLDVLISERCVGAGGGDGVRISLRLQQEGGEGYDVVLREQLSVLVVVDGLKHERTHPSETLMWG